MNDEQWLALLEARMEEVCNAISSLKLGDFLTRQCDEAAREVVGIHLDVNNFNMTTVAVCMYARLSRGTMTLDEAVTHLNNLPLGLKIADLQREEALQEEPELAQEFIPAEPAPGEKSLEQLCDEYEESVCTGKQSIEAQAYIMALEDLVSQLQGKSFTDNSKISSLEYDLAQMKRSEEAVKWNDMLHVDLHSSTAEQLAEDIVKKEDDLVRMVLTKRGVDADDLEALRPRVTCVKPQYSRVKTLYLDGEAILEIQDFTVSHHGDKLVSSLHYRELVS